MSQLPIPYVPRYSLVERARRWWPAVPAPLADMGTLVGIATAAFTTAAVIALIAVNTWK